MPASSFVMIPAAGPLAAPVIATALPTACLASSGISPTATGPFSKRTIPAWSTTPAFPVGLSILAAVEPIRKMSPA